MRISTKVQVYMTGYFCLLYSFLSEQLGISVCAQIILIFSLAFFAVGFKNLKGIFL